MLAVDTKVLLLVQTQSFFFNFRVLQAKYNPEVALLTAQTYLAFTNLDISVSNLLIILP